MLPEIAILKYLLKYSIYNKYYKYIDINKYNYKELSIICQVLPRFFEKHGQKDATLEQFTLFFFAHYPRLKPEEISAYRTIFDQAAASTVTEAQVDEYVRVAERRTLAERASLSLASYAAGTLSEDELSEALKGLSAVQAQDEREARGRIQYVTDDLEELLNVTYTTPGLRWRLDCLNRSLGSLRPGNFGFVFARPETGKTTFLASEVTHFATQSEKPVLWLNNEQPGWEVKTRLIQAALGLPMEVFLSDMKKWKKVYLDKFGGRIKLVDDKALHKSTVAAAIDELKPSVIVIDQLDKVYGFEAERNDLVLGFKYQWARQMAVSAPLIGVCQADASGDGVKWLTMNNVADAKTAKQAEADFIIGIGKTVNNSDMEDPLEYARYLNIIKNKLFGDKDSNPAMRHGKLHAWIEPAIARYKDMGD